ncbi:MAG: carboxypeptidase regulatory-like domain-containing protein [Gemmatimonadales bacterium]
MRRVVLVSLFWLAVPWLRLVGQSSTDLIVGQITTAEGQPVAAALVEALSLETQVVRSARTNAQGRYTIVFPDGGGQYQMTVRAIGMRPVQRVIARQVDEDRLVFNASVSATPTQLEEIVVSGRRRQLDPDRPTAGSTERAFTPEQLARLPIDAGDLALLATLAPGVVAIEGTDSTGASFSVAGQRPGDNNITLDGLSFGAASIPQDAVRVSRVITNSYDASRGQFSGGLVSSTSRSGTNVVQGSGNYSLRDRGLEVSASDDDAFSRGFTQHQLSFGLGGPIIRNKLFAFVSGQGRFRGDELQSLLNAPSTSLVRLGASPDSVARFLGLLDDFGLPVSLGGEADRSSTNLSALLRVDWNLAEAHTLTFRGDYRDSRQEPTRVSPLSVPSTGGTQSSTGGGGMLVLNSRFGTAIVNELRAYYSESSNDASSTERFPAGRVQVASSLDDGSGGFSMLAFGGNPGLPQFRSSRSFEATNELNWLPGSAAHRIKLGGFLSLSSEETDATTNRYGTFLFNSLADFEAGRPTSFTRTLAPMERSSTSRTAALYLTDQWRVNEALQLSLGVRAEASGSRGAPGLNQAVLDRFGIRTDRLPSEVRVSPRIGFTWILGGLSAEAPPSWFVRGGIGEFRSRFPTALVGSALAASGSRATESQLVCIGAAAPMPDWPSYLANPGSIPTDCLAGAGSPPIATRQPAVTAFAEDFGAPRAWRGSLGVTRRFGLKAVSAELSYARGASQFGFTDLNLGPARFALVEEAGRPFYSPVAAVDARTGAVSLFGSRLDPAYGQVLRIDSDLASESTQLTISAQGTTRRALVYSLSYTRSRSRDQSSFSGGQARGGFGAATTGGDPNVREWSTSDFERRHAFLATVTLPVTDNLEVTSIARFSSGTPYTPRVSGDVNGDGVSGNDRAFVFSASAADTAIANGKARLLESTSGGVRACLERQSGRIAERNSCSGPWRPSLDLQVNFRPTFLGLNQRLLISLTTINLLSGVDELTHGADDLKGWGQGVRPDATLLSVQGFDPQTQRFRYVVNERFGATTASANAIRAPFQLGVQARYSIGPDRRRDFLRGLRGGFGGRGGGPGVPGNPRGPGLGPTDVLSRIDSLNPARQLIEIRIALRLSDDQVTRLGVVADSMTARVGVLRDSAQAQLARTGGSTDPSRVMASLFPLLGRLRELQREALAESEQILSPEQWAQVPERIRRPMGLGRGGQRRPNQ